MSKELWAVVFICVVVLLLYWIFKAILFVWRRTKRIARKVLKSEAPSAPPPSYEISVRDFMRIAYKVGYRHPRTEEVWINGGQIELKFASQSGFSMNKATISFVLSGSDFGLYSIQSTNHDSDVPKHIADKIQSEIRKIVGIV